MKYAYGVIASYSKPGKWFIGYIDEQDRFRKAPEFQEYFDSRVEAYEALKNSPY